MYTGTSIRRRRPSTSVPVIIYAQWSMLTRMWCSNLWTIRTLILPPCASLTHNRRKGRGAHAVIAKKRWTWQMNCSWLATRDEQDWLNTIPIAFPQLPVCYTVHTYIRTYVCTMYVCMYMYICSYILYVATVYYIIIIILLCNICFMNAASGLCTRLAREQRYALNRHIRANSILASAMVRM